MKLPFRDIESFVKRVPDAVKAVLVYGPDQGLVKERADIIAKQIVEDLTDPFNVCDLTPAMVTEEIGRLGDEANAISMMGGRRLIRVSHADDKITQSVKQALTDLDNTDSFILITAGGLGPRAPLRALFEKEKKIAAALPCYVEEGRGLTTTITTILQKDGKRAEREALNFLQLHLKGDRMTIRSELEKLCIYVGDNPVITYDDCMAIIGTRGETGFNEITNALGSGDLKTLELKLNQAFLEGFPPPSMLRAFQNHLKRLHKCKVLMREDSLNSKEAMNAIHPPVFFKEEAAFQAQMNRWSEKRLEYGLMALINAEKEVKSSGTVPPELICSSAAFKIASF